MFKNMSLLVTFNAGIGHAIWQEQVKSLAICTWGEKL